MQPTLATAEHSRIWLNHQRESCCSWCAMYGTSKFKAFRLDIDKRKYEEIASLEDDAVFVGHNAAFSVPASKFPDVIRPNSLYSMDAYFVSYIHCKKCDKFHSGDRDERCERNHEEVAAKVAALMKKSTTSDGKWPWVWENRGNLDAMEGGGKNMGIYDFEKGSIQRFDQTLETISLICPPLWVSPSDPHHNAIVVNILVLRSLFVPKIASVLV